MARDLSVGVEITAEDRASRVLASFEGELGKIGESTESLGGALRRLGVNLEQNVEKKIEANNKVLAAAAKAFQDGRISAEDFNRATTAVADSNAKLQESIGKTATEADASASAFVRFGSALRSGVVAAAAAAAAAIAGIAVALRAGIPAASEQEDAIKRLGNALSGLGPSSGRVTEALVAQASALQEVTRYSDDAIIAGQAFAAAFIRSEESLKAVTQSAVDLAAGLGIDLQTAFELLTKASQGNTSAFSRYGLVLDENIPKAEKLAEVQKLIAERFAGRAQDDVKTFSGVLAQLGNAWGEVLEAIGDAVIKNQTILDSLNQLKATIALTVPFVASLAKGIIELGSVAVPKALGAFQVFGAFLTTFALATSLALEGVVKLGRGILHVGSIIPGLGSSLEGAAESLKRFDDRIDPFQRKAAALASELGRAGLGLDEFSRAAYDGAARTAALGAAAESAGPAFTSYRTAAQLAAEETAKNAKAFADAETGANEYATVLTSQVAPALDAVSAKAKEASTFIQGVVDRSGNLIQGVVGFSQGGTRAELSGGGSRLVGRTGGTYGSQTRVSSSGSATYIADPLSGRIERIG